MVKQAKKKKSGSALLPVMGFLLAIVYGVIAYYLSPVLTELLMENSARFESRIGDMVGQFELGLSFVLWILLMAISFMMVAGLLGEDPDKEMQVLKPRPGDKKQTKRYIRYQEKLAKKRQQQIKEKKAREEGNKRR
jgi:hypothetical protein